MAAIPYTVAEAFLNGETARAGSFVSVGDAIYSYALKLAHREGGDDWLIGTVVLDHDLNARQPSVTTARHVKALRAVLADHPGVTVEQRG
jgi:hypothetical protein